MFASEFDYCGSHSLRSRISIMGEDLPTYIRRWNIVERFAERLEVEETYGEKRFLHVLQDGLASKKCPTVSNERVETKVDYLYILSIEDQLMEENCNVVAYTVCLISRIHAAMSSGDTYASEPTLVSAAEACIAEKIKPSAGAPQVDCFYGLSAEDHLTEENVSGTASIVCCSISRTSAEDSGDMSANEPMMVSAAEASTAVKIGWEVDYETDRGMSIPNDADCDDDEVAYNVSACVTVSTFRAVTEERSLSSIAIDSVDQLDKDTADDSDEKMSTLLTAEDYDSNKDRALGSFGFNGDYHSNSDGDDDEVRCTHVTSAMTQDVDRDVRALLVPVVKSSIASEERTACCSTSQDVSNLFSAVIIWTTGDSDQLLDVDVPDLVDASDSDSDSEDEERAVSCSASDAIVHKPSAVSEERAVVPVAKPPLTACLSEEFLGGKRSILAFPISLSVDDSSEGPDYASRNYVYDDSLSNVPIFSNVQLLQNVRELKEPIVVGGVGGAVITKCGTHPFLGNVLVLPSLKYNIVPQHYWKHRFGYELTFRKNCTELVASKDGCVDIVFEEHASSGRCFKRVHNNKLRCHEKGPVSRATVVSHPGAARAVAMPSVPVPAAARYYTAEQRQRAAEVLVLHQQLKHPSDAVLIAYLKSPSVTNCALTEADVRAMRDIYGACPTCAMGKPLPVKGTNSLHEGLGVTRPGSLLHCDIVFVRDRTYLIAVDDFSRYVYMIQLESKHTNDVMVGFKIVIEAMRASHHVVQCVHSDAEAVFEACRGPLSALGTGLKLRIPGEHEPVAERSVRIVREKIRMQLHQIKEAGLPHPTILDPYLIQACVLARNSVPNTHSEPLVPSEIVHGERINFLTDNVADYFDLILVATPGGSKDPSRAKHEVCLCLGTVGRRTPGAVYALSKDSKRVTQRRPLRVMPWTPDWRRHVVDMAVSGGQSVFEDFFIQETGTVAKDLSEPPESLEERDEDYLRLSEAALNIPVVKEAHVENSQNVSPAVAAARALMDNARRNVNDAASAASAVPVVHVPSTTTPTTPLPNTRRNQSTPVSVAAPIDEGLRRSTRVRIPNSMLKGTTGEVSMCADLDHCTRVAYAILGDVEVDDDDVLPSLVSAEDEDDEWDQPPIAMVVSLEAAMKTANAVAAAAAAKKEIKSLIDHKTWRYLRNVSERQPSTHAGVEPSACIVKDKKDSRGQFLLYKARLFDVGSHTNDNNYGAFDKTSPTADHTTICLMVALASHWGLMVETFDVPSAYVKATLPEGKRHCMRINKTVAALVVEVDPDAKRYLQADGTLLVELLQALYGLPEAGNLWHAFLCAIFRKAGYTQMPGDSCVWKRVISVNGEKGISLCAIIVDDVLHMFNKISMRDHLYEVLKREKVPSVTVQPLTEKSPVSFCGLSLERTGKDVLFMSQPGFLEALVADMCETDAVYPTPLPSNYSTRKLTVKQMEPMPGGTRKYLRTLNSVAWLERTRLDICAAVSYLQTEQANPRVIDWDDLQHVLGYLRGAGNLGISYYVKSMQPFQSIDVAFAVHPRDRTSHTGWVITVGPEGPPAAWGTSKQKGVAPSSTDGELVGLSDKADNLLVVESKLIFFGVKVTRPMTILQDNTSTITMSYMGRPSAHARRRFIDIRYFWLKQYLDDRTFELVYCASQLMLADPLASIRGGQEFARFVRRLMSVGPLRVFDQRK